MTNPTYEVNIEKLSDLSISDLASMLTLWKLYPSTSEKAIALNTIISEEFGKRINDIIIF